MRDGFLQREHEAAIEIVATRHGAQRLPVAGEDANGIGRALVEVLVHAALHDRDGRSGSTSDTATSVMTMVATRAVSAASAMPAATRSTSAKVPTYTLAVVSR